MLITCSLLALGAALTNLTSSGPDIAEVLEAANIQPDLLIAAGIDNHDALTLTSNLADGTFDELYADVVEARNAQTSAMTSLASFQDQIASSGSDSAHETLREHMEAVQAATGEMSRAQSSLRSSLISTLTAEDSAALERCLEHAGYQLGLEFRVLSWPQDDMANLAIALRAKERADRTGVPLDPTSAGLISSAESSAAVIAARYRLQVDDAGVRTILATPRS